VDPEGKKQQTGGGPLEFIVSLPALPVVWAEIFMRRHNVHERIRCRPKPDKRTYKSAENESKQTGKKAAMRRKKPWFCAAILTDSHRRYSLLNVMAYITAPAWFFIVTAMHLLLLAAITAISLGMLLPWTGPIMLAVAGYRESPCFPSHFNKV
jgi:hypothetical protein